MKSPIGIRREDKNEWEARVPLVPEHVKELIEKHSLEFLVQPSPIRALPEDAYKEAGAKIEEDLSPCSIIFAVKEVPVEKILPEKTYIFFSHTVKGQDYNMPMLKRLMELKCSVIDYERIVDEKERRLVFFGRHAGLAGMVESLHALGTRLAWEGIATPFSSIKQAHQYHGLKEAKEEIAAVGEEIKKNGLPKELVPVVFGFPGYGHVSRGAWEIFDLLPHREVSPADLAALGDGGEEGKNTLFKVIFKEEHLVEPVSPDVQFELQDYYQHPEKYRSQFEQYVPILTVLVNGIYWEEKYPRLITKEYIKSLFEGGQTPRLRVIGDVSCDIDGSIECTVKPTDAGNPTFVYNPATGQATDGVEGEGVVVMAVDNLPCEFPRDASKDFGDVLKNYVPALMNADFSGSLESCSLPAPLRKALILYQGELTPEYKYMKEYLK